MKGAKNDRKITGHFCKNRPKITRFLWFGAKKGDRPSVFKGSWWTGAEMNAQKRRSS
jgi:hypothetical protein